MSANDIPLDEWNAYLDKELSVFKEGEKYDYVKDLQEGFSTGLSTPVELKIFRTIPAHVFWDIKKPLNTAEEFYMNPYNPARKYPNEDFFDIRTNEEWLRERKENMKMKANVSMHRNY
jgi:hypothetical protein